MNILYTCDNNYVWLMGISMISLFENNKDAKEICVYLLGKDISTENINILNDLAKKYNRVVKIIDVPKLDIPDSLISTRWPISAFTRLFSGTILPKNIKKILYLDCDTIICGNITDLNNKDMENNVVCGVLDCISDTYKKNIGLSKDNPYINAGVLLIDLEHLRKVNIKETIDCYMKKYMKLINYADQDILNGIFKGKIGIISPEYDVMTIDVAYTYEEICKLRRPTLFYTKQELEQGVKNRKVVHYTTNMRIVRPWFKNSDHPLAYEFVKYMKMSPWNSKDLPKMKFTTRESKIIGIIEKLPKKISCWLLGLIHSKLKPLIIRMKAGGIR